MSIGGNQVTNNHVNVLERLHEESSEVDRQCFKVPSVQFAVFSVLTPYTDTARGRSGSS